MNNAIIYLKFKTIERNNVMEYKMTIAGCERSLQLCPISDDLYIAGFILFGDVEITEASAKALLEKCPEFDVIVTAESKGIPLAYEMARMSGKPYIVARKGAKLYMQDIVKVEVTSITTDHVQTLCVGRDEKNKIANNRVLIVDDVISTGESLKALVKLVEAIDGNIVGSCAVLAEGDAANRDDIIFLEKLPLFDGAGNPL